MNFFNPIFSIQRRIPCQILLFLSLLQVSHPADKWDPGFSISLSNCDLVLTTARCPTKSVNRNLITKMFSHGERTMDYGIRAESCLESSEFRTLARFYFPDQICKGLYLFKVSISPLGSHCDDICQIFVTYGPFLIGKTICKNFDKKCEYNKYIPLKNECNDTKIECRIQPSQFNSGGNSWIFIFLIAFFFLVFLVTIGVIVLLLLRCYRKSERVSLKTFFD